ncbi:MAG: MATE family efflux transporter [Phocaeicola sp.]|nr:MATE family efflux transporter [Phocaeicola sp.]
MNNNRYEERLGTDPMLPLVFRMAIPAVAAQFVNLLYNIVDRIYIGHIPHIGTEALAGVGVTTSIVILISSFSAIVGAGGAPLAAMALGQGDRDRAGRILGNGFVMLIFFTLITSLVAYLFMKPILLLTGASEHTLPYAVDYLSVYLLGTLFVEISTGLNSFINSQGRPAIAMWSVVIGALLNIVLDPIFIFVFDMGVKGAAIATVISQAFSALWILRFLTSEKASLPLERKYMKLQRSVVMSVVALGVSPFIMASTESLVGFVLNGSLKHFGDIYVSALAIMQSAMQFASVPLTGFAQGFVPVVSYNYGHAYKDRVKQCFKIVMTFMFGFNLFLILVMIIFPSYVASVFTSDEELISTVSSVMPLFLAGMSIFGLQRACQNMFVALGQARISIFIALLRKVILLVPLALLLPSFWGVNGIFAAEAISDATAAICCTALFFWQFPKILNRIKTI